MTLIQLQYFQSVCKYENFTRAAEEWHISQPAMSAAIKDLEKECGVALFRRDKNALSITDEGKVLLDEAGLILAQYDHLHRVVEKLSLARNYVRIGLSTLSGNLVYPEILQAFHRKYPNIQVISVEESTNRQFEMLEGGFLDAVITIRSFTDEEQQKKFDGKYGHWPLVKSRQVFCVGKENPLSKEKTVTIEQIAQQPLILLKERYGQTRRIKRQLDQTGIPYSVVHYTDQMYTVERFVEKNIAAGFLPDSVADANPNIVGIEYKDMKPVVVEIFWKKGKYQFEATKRFIALVKEKYPR